MRHPRVVKWEKRLKELFDSIDAELEEEWGHQYSLHPSRPAQGETASAESDGLFSIGAVFSAGYGSEKGRGYVVQIHLSTLDQVPPTIRKKIQDEVADALTKKLPEFFPNQTLAVEQDGPAYKITGDFRLGTL